MLSRNVKTKTKTFYANTSIQTPRLRRRLLSFSRQKSSITSCLIDRSLSMEFCNVSYPKGEENQVIRCIWSPKVCLFERKQNIRPLHDLRYDAYERSVTFEGEEFHVESLPVRGFQLPQKM